MEMDAMPRLIIHSVSHLAVLIQIRKQNVKNTVIIVCLSDIYSIIQMVFSNSWQQYS